MISKIFLFPNTAVVAFDEQGEQVAEAQTVLFCDHLKRLKILGLVTNDTPIESNCSDMPTVGSWIGPQPSQDVDIKTLAENLRNRPTHPGYFNVEK